MSDTQRNAEEQAIAAWLATNKPKKLRKGKANAPPITKIRQAIRHGKTLVVRRSGGRDISYGPQPLQGSDSQAAGEHLRAAARSRRRLKRLRSAQKPPA